MLNSDFLTKLIEILDNRLLGSWMDPIKARKMGAVETLNEYEKALKLKKLEISSQGLLELSNSEGRVEPTINMDLLQQQVQRDQLKKEQNVVGSLRYAVAALGELQGKVHEKQEEKISLDQDWVLRWRGFAEQTSHENLQELWGKILAGEVKRPGQFSFRLLSFLNNLSYEEAIEIQKIGPLVLNGSIYNDRELLEQRGLNSDFILKMVDMGVIHPSSIGLGMILQFHQDKEKEVEGFLLGINKGISFKLKRGGAILRVKIMALTEIGIQLIKLGKFELDDFYLEQVVSDIEKENRDLFHDIKIFER